MFKKRRKALFICAIFCFPMIVLGFNGYAKQRKLSK